MDISNFIIILLMILISTSATLAQKQTVVVGAIGEEPKPGLRKALETQIKEAFVKDGRYTAVTRDEAVLSAVNNEFLHQYSGAVDDSEIRQIGKQLGAQYVCVIEIAPLMNSYTLSAQFVDIESAQIVNIASVTNMLRNPNEFLTASVELVDKLLGYAEKPVSDKKVLMKYVAVIETKIDTLSAAAKEIGGDDLTEITSVLRREAVKNLPEDRFNVMTSETVMSMGAAVAQDCAEENCIITIGSKIGADYIVRGTLSKIRKRYSLTVELFETEYGNLVAVTPSPIRSKDLDDLLDKSEEVCAAMYKNFAGRSLSATAATSVPEAAAAPPISPPIEMPTSPPYMFIVNINNSEGGKVSWTPSSPDFRYDVGTKVTVTANPAQGYAFAGWTEPSGDIKSARLKETFTIIDNLMLTANFVKDDDFTQTERWMTLWMNILPGLGSSLIMKDKIGARVSWSIFLGATAISLIYWEEGHSNSYRDENSYGSSYSSGRPNEAWFGAGMVGYAVIWNLYRTFTYHKPGSFKSKKPAKTASVFSNDAFNVSVFPDRNGKWQTAALYMAEF